MPLVTLHLLALAAKTSPAAFLRSIPEPLVVSRPQRWIIKPEVLSVSALLDTQWDLLLIFPNPSPLTNEHLAGDQITNHFTITAGVPSSLVNGFKERNEGLLSPRKGDVPPLTGALSNPKMASSAQGLELNNELLQWSKSFELGRGAVSMLNLLAFKPEKQAHENYQKYGQGFAESAGAKRGGQAKIVGKVVDGDGWDEIALAHYPSIDHFTEMLASEDYQAINHKFRLPSLKDTCILCTSELDPKLSREESKL